MTWCRIISRCTNPNVRDWHNYGGRGIKICDLWRESFLSFFEYVGPRPGPEYSLDRINNDGNYEPGNVRWATKKEQVRNQRRTTHVEYEGKIIPVADLADKTGVRYNTLRGRLDRGWSLERALTLPVKKPKVSAAMDEWKLISEAPKDGRRILLWLADEQFWIVGKWDAKEEMWHLPEWDMWTGEDGIHLVTHFLDPTPNKLPPIPAPGEEVA